MPSIEELYTKYLSSTITDAEKQELFDQIKQADNNLLEQFADKYLNTNAPTDLDYLQDHTEQLLRKIKHRIAEPEKEYKPRRLWPLLSYVGAAAAIVVIVFFVYQYGHRYTIESNAQTTQLVNDLAPGGNKATLKLADGRTITLENAHAGQLAEIDGIRISKTIDGQVVYENNVDGHGTSQPNTITIPRGGEYQLFLPDGTRVWLNAATTITYPSRFIGTERKVKLSGEAYFQVAKDPDHPFIVETDQQQVKVLGTHFNINTYNDNRTITTLEEGSVRVASLLGTKQSVTIKPNQQAISTQQNLMVQPANIESALAWKNGLLLFRDAPLPSVLDEVSRWYDVDIEYRGTRPNKILSGGVERTANLSAMLKILRLTGVKVNLQIEGKSRKLIVEQ